MQTTENMKAPNQNRLLKVYPCLNESGICILSVTILNINFGQNILYHWGGMCTAIASYFSLSIPPPLSLPPLFPQNQPFKE